MDIYQCNCNSDNDIKELLINYRCPKCKSLVRLIMLENGCVLSLKDYISLKNSSFDMTTEQMSNLYMSLIKQGLNEVQISDVLKRIETKDNYNKYLK